MNAPITAAGLYALMPLLILSATAVGVMLVIAFVRNHKLTAGLTAAGMGAALLACGLVAFMPEQQVTPLLNLNTFEHFYSALLIWAALGVVMLCYGYFDSYQGQRDELYLLLTLATIGAVIMVGSSHMAAFFLGLELLSVSLFGLIAYPLHESRPLEAGVKYLVLSAAATAFLLFGMALVYAELGTMSLPAIGQQLTALVDQPLRPMLLLGAAMITVTVGFKLSLVPFHLWTPDVYEGAPAPITGFLATVSKGAVLALLLRGFVESAAYKYEPLMDGLAILAVLSIIVGNLLALQQVNIKRLLAYSSIAHFGYALVGFLIAGPLAVEAVTMYLVTYFATTLGAFGVMGLMSTPMSERDADTLYDYRGLFWRRPYLTGVFSVMLLSLAGIPITAGFIGKFYIFAVGISAELWVPLAAVALGSVIGLYYYLRVLVALYKPARAGEFKKPEIGWPERVYTLALLFLVVMVLGIGVYPQPMIEIAKAVAASLY